MAEEAALEDYTDDGLAARLRVLSDCRRTWIGGPNSVLQPDAAGL